MYIYIYTYTYMIECSCTQLDAFVVCITQLKEHVNAHFLYEHLYISASICVRYNVVNIPQLNMMT